MSKFCAGVLGFVLGVLMGASAVAHAEDCINPTQALSILDQSVGVDSHTAMVGQQLIDFKMYLSEQVDGELSDELLASTEVDLYYNKSDRRVLWAEVFVKGCAVAEGPVPTDLYLRFKAQTAGKYNDKDM